MAGITIGAIVRERAQRLTHDPAIDHRHDVVAFGGRNELGRQHQLAVLAAHAHEQLVVTARIAVVADRHDRLVVQLQAVFFAGARQARDPLHFAVALGCRAVLIHVYAVAARVFRGVARDVGGAEDAADAFAAAVDLDDADADTDVHRAVLPFEAVFADRLPQAVRNLRGALGGAVLQQNAELVAAETRDRVAGANAGLQNARDLLQQAVAGLVTAGVVDE